MNMHKYKCVCVCVCYRRTCKNMKLLGSNSLGTKKKIYCQILTLAMNKLVSKLYIWLC